MRTEGGYSPTKENRWHFSIPKNRRLTPDEIIHAGDALFYDFLGPRISREAFMMDEDSHDLAYRLLYLVGKEQHQRRVAAAISTATEALDGVVRKDGLPHLRHALRVGLRTTYRLLDLHGTLTDKDIETIEAMINHDTREDARGKGMKDREIKNIWLKHSTRESKTLENLNNPFSSLIENVKDRLRNRRIYKVITIFDQNDQGGQKNPRSDQKLKKAGLSSEKMSDDTLDSLLGDISWASRLLRQKNPSATAKELTDIYLLLAGSTDRRKKGSVYKTEQRQAFFEDKLTHYDHNQIAIYLATASKIIQNLEERLRERTPGSIPSPREQTVTQAV